MRGWALPRKGLVFWRSRQYLCTKPTQDTLPEARLIEPYIFRACEASGWTNSLGWAALGGILSCVRDV